MASHATHLRHAAADPVEHRRGPRLPVRITRATVRKKGEMPTDAVLHDLSIYGCRLMVRIKQYDGEKLWLRFRGSEPVAATVVWYDTNFAGCRFDEPISKALWKSLTSPDV